MAPAGFTERPVGRIPGFCLEVQAVSKSKQLKKICSFVTRMAPSVSKSGIQREEENEKETEKEKEAEKEKAEKEKAEKEKETESTFQLEPHHVAYIERK